ncbi:MAG: hypothetical protein HYV34_03580 [Candidatus Kerfeldbacteria bacterium]|nr:hypothetical protein [Candidatus Kerfeldbacteria bacterium]
MKKHTTLNETFGTAITCIDGRVQEPLATWMCQHFSLDYVDMITEPGPDHVLRTMPDIAKELKREAGISKSAHRSRIIAVAGHAGCAGNPASADEHVREIRECVRIVESWGLGIPVIGVFVNDAWTVEEVAA